MDLSIKSEMKKVCQGTEWRKVVELIESGYKGIFVILRMLREKGEGIVSAELAKELNVSTARIAAALNTLERKGYIKRTPSELDGRKVLASITPLGSEALEAREREVNGIIDPMFGKLTAEERATFFALLKKLLQ